MVKKMMVIVWLMLLFLAIGALFWYNEIVYHLPTPVPANYKAVKNGTPINLGHQIKDEAGKPIFLHFFNPDCPCSRFNIANFSALVKLYGSKVNFVVVVVSRKKFTVAEVQNKFDLKIPIVFDTGLATACGVYSTPQAVLLDSRHQLYYRGNYNRSRYCTDEKTSFAKMAIVGLLKHHNGPSFNQLALQAYGCSLPNCGLQ